MIERYIDHQLFLSHDQLCSLTYDDKHNFSILKSLSNVSKIDAKDLQSSNVKIEDFIDIILETDNKGNERIWLRDYSPFCHSVIESIESNRRINPIELYNYIEEFI